MDSPAITTPAQLLDWMLAEGYVTEADLVGSQIITCARGGEG